VNADPSELSNTENNATVTPSIAPAGVSGALVLHGDGAAHFEATQSGGGIYFSKCCDNSSSAYYEFNGASVGTIFDTNQGQVSFNLTSRSTVAQRMAAGVTQSVYDVRDQDPNNHLYGFSIGVAGGSLAFNYTVNNVPQTYYAPKGTEEALFGKGVSLKVSISWDGSNMKLYLNGKLAQSASYSKPSPNWSDASTFAIGAYKNLDLGGFNACDDVIGAFSVAAEMNQ